MTKLNDLLQQLHNASSSRRIWGAVTIFARLALGLGFLSAVADRFGLWGEAGTGAVSWGGFDSYLTYVHELAPYLSTWLVDVAGWAATIGELALGIALLLGVAVRPAAWASTGLLLFFALSMFFFSNPEAPLSSSVFSAAAAAVLLALAPAGTLDLSLDRIIGLDRRRSDTASSASSIRANV